MEKWSKTGNDDCGDMPEAVMKIYTTFDLWQQAWEMAGKILFYLEFIYPKVFCNQESAIKQMCYYLAQEHKNRLKNTKENREWFHSWIATFAAETENMC